MDIVKWSTDVLVEACSHKPTGNKKLIIPTFQRRRAWTQEKEDSLIETMKHNKLSIGCLETYYLKTEGKIDVYLIIDGLHRCTTLAKYYKNPLKFGRIVSMIDTLKESLVKKYKKSYDEEIFDKIFSRWFNSSNIGSYDDIVVEKSFTEKFDDLKQLVEKYVDKQDKNDISKLIIDGTRLLSKEIDISKTSVPVILNIGDDKNLPILFERINQAGTPLTTTEVFAAKWYNNEKIKITNKNIIKFIKEYYDEMRIENNGMDIHHDSNDSDEEYTVYEYIIGLNKYIVDKCPNGLFCDTKDFMFKLLGFCLYGEATSKKLNELGSTITNCNRTLLEKKLLWTINFVSDAINHVVMINKKTHECLVKEITLILSMYATVYRNDEKIKKNINHYSNVLLLNLVHEKILNRITAKDIKSTIHDKKFLTKLDSDEFKTNFDKLITDNVKLKTERGNPPVNKIILMVIKNILYPGSDDSFEFDNIVTNKTILKYKNENGEKLFAKSLGNLCLYPSDIPKPKSDTIIRYLDSSSMSEDDIYDKVLFLGKSNDFDNLLKQTITKKKFMDFLKFRMNNMKKIILKHFIKYFNVDTDTGDEKDNSYDESNGDSDESNDSNDSSASDSDESDDDTIRYKIINKTR